METSALHWGFLPALTALSVLHYVCAALALQAAAGRPLPLREATLTQFTAAAANRLVPGGIGAAAVNVRYLTCHGLAAPRAIAGVTALHAATALGDLLLFLAVLGVGQWTGAGGTRVLTELGAHTARTAGRLPLPWMLVSAGAVAALVLFAWWRRRGQGGRLLAALGQTVTALAELRRRPRDLLVTVTATAATTLVLSLAFAMSVLAVPGASAPGAMLTLLAAYFIGAAAGSVLPVPAAIGSTEAALVAALGGAEVSAGHALQAVVLFRVVTYWAPVPVGLYAARVLRRSRAEPATAVPVPIPAR
ncbi:lysylphosphatidylglycerol synthase transmembrane domain-containing protein [Actinomadura scrupuli]|uniref:lysylphosphatidylglycerol synthase transmembrane domain-containing protein n=1 Tax=Actinomadura scrupuli TaxID=559629 RepID=UPI003D98F9A3